MNSFKYCTPDSTLLSTNIWNTMNCYITVVLHGNDILLSHFFFHLPHIELSLVQQVLYILAVRSNRAMGERATPTMYGPSSLYREKISN